MQIFGCAAGTWYADFSFCELFGLHLILCFFAIFTNFLFFLNFYLDFLFFLVTVFFLMWDTEPRQKLAFGRVVSLVCGRVDSHRGPVPALEGAE